MLPIIVFFFMISRMKSIINTMYKQMVMILNQDQWSKKLFMISNTITTINAFKIKALFRLFNSV
ncbi:hypothetical protein J6TS1_17620 [Siminovitchia terrae]|uniref:ATP synthase F0 subunit 8 n=1 Tax=Siminovitchia terrae TaxID=1914933 RepID=A0ABQ4KW23_SIMTE|nr:hypothetical protein J6TS1_17620 [Siminovitchia terrae]